ncbi:hypothetical protein [Microbacterium sp. K2]|uniref:hypothetical protein n=1 Tax=Microbacterium sp. K2 TaxID=3391827 RepID=UPI003ED96400
MANKGLRKYRRVFTGGSAGLTGGGVSTSLVQTDGSYLHALIALIDNKGAFFDPLDLEHTGRLADSVKEVRTLAVATQSSVESQEAYEIAFAIADACRVFMRDFDESMDLVVWGGVLTALRREVERQTALAVLVFQMPTPRNLDLKAQDETVQLMLEKLQSR